MSLTEHNLTLFVTHMQAKTTYQMHGLNLRHSTPCIYFQNCINVYVHWNILWRIPYFHTRSDRERWWSGKPISLIHTINTTTIISRSTHSQERYFMLATKRFWMLEWVEVVFEKISDPAVMRLPQNHYWLSFTSNKLRSNAAKPFSVNILPISLTVMLS